MINLAVWKYPPSRNSFLVAVVPLKSFFHGFGVFHFSKALGFFARLADFN